MLARAKELVETSEVLSLKPPKFDEGPTVPRGSEPRGVLNCMAYDYEVKIAINGAPLKFSGGKSFSGVLFEAPAGTQPAEPAVLRMGENQITVEYRKTPGILGPGLTVDIIAFPPANEPLCVLLIKQGVKGPRVPGVKRGDWSPVEGFDSVSLNP